MITEAHGDLLNADVDALVNTVNTVGVMGKGIALQFRRAYPEMFDAYTRACKAGEVQVGRMHVWPTGALTGPKFIVNFPTKKHWRAPSQMAYIDEGLVDLVSVVKEFQIRSIAIPPLGAGNGGLDWAEVRPRIESALGDVPDVDVRLYVPEGAPAAASMKPRAAKLLTLGRAALIEVVEGYVRTAVGASPIEVQKLMYFLQEAGEPLRLRYQAHLYGPYADNLRHVLNELEGAYLIGYGDGSARVQQAEPIVPLPGAAEKAAEVLSKHPETRARIKRVLAVADGFDSMYGMELLATVHWAATHDADDPSDVPGIIKRVQSWNKRKRVHRTAHSDRLGPPPRRGLDCSLTGPTSKELRHGDQLAGHRACDRGRAGARHRGRVGGPWR